MNDTAASDRTELDQSFIQAVRTALAKGEPVRRKLPGWGRLHVDRQLPFVCVYRRPPDHADAGTKQLLLGEAAYVLAPGEAEAQPGLGRLLEAIVETQMDQFGTALLLELWAGPEPLTAEPSRRPAMRIVAPARGAPAELLEQLESAILAIEVSGQSPQVTVQYREHVGPPGLAPLLQEEDLAGLYSIGLELDPVYRDAATEEIFHYKLQELHHGLAHALKRTFYAFAHRYTSHRPAHYHELGRHAMTTAVWETDRQLAEISDSFDILLHVTPVNASHAWAAFQNSGYEKTPEFNYRPRPVNPDLLKRKLYTVPIERIEDPTLAHIFSSKRDELARQITLVGDRNTPRFIHGSQQIYGEVEPWLLQLAQDLVEKISPSAGGSAGQWLDANAFAEYAREEMAHYKNMAPEFSARVEVREDVTGIMVSKGNFLIGSDASVSMARMEATLSHEIGTHVLTSFNGRQQPFHQLHAGMAGYEPLQEGMAVLSEYLVGQLSPSRLRLLAGRVLAVHSLAQGGSFVDTFRLLCREYQFSERTAFTITMRVYRGGGFTKDAVYLRGLALLLDHLAQGGDLAMLLVGKVALEYLPFIEELQWRKVVKPGVLLPRYLQKPEAQARLQRLQQGMNMVQLVEECVA